ncbi:MAG: hypothetical protein KU29_03780 [Sulfurovum sp. FS06-10]|nr:MAG: hypothetical protein KU29_03780 [Sulfurovum sp. FS06-10]
MSILIQFTVIMIVLELIEAKMQKASTLGTMIERLYGYYQKSVFLFFLIHPTFYFALFVSLYLDLLDFYMIVILLMKTFDIFFKIEMIKQKYITKNMERELTSMLELKMAPWMEYLGVIIYVPLFIMALFT